MDGGRWAPVMMCAMAGCPTTQPTTTQPTTTHDNTNQHTHSFEETKGRKTELHYAAYTHQLGRVVTRYGPYPDQEKE